MTTATHGHGITLTSCATTNFTTVTTYGQITSINGPNHSRDSIDISNCDSTSKWREFLTGMIDAGEMSLDVVCDGDANATALKNQYTNSSAYWKITFADGTNAAASSSVYSAGFMTALGHSLSFDDKVMQNVTIKLSGAPVFDAKT